MKSHFIPAVGVLLILAQQALQAQITTTFETPDISLSGIYYGEALVWYQTFPEGSSVDGWTVSSGSVDIVRHVADTARNGVQSVDLNGSSAGTLTRTLVTQAGQKYLLEFDFSGNPIDGRVRELQIWWNGREAAAFLWNPSEQQNSFQTDMKWQKQTVELIATNTTSTLELVSGRPGASGPQIDNISFRPAISVTVQSALLLTWDMPASGPFGAVLEAADHIEGPWRLVRPTLLNVLSEETMAATVLAADAAKFYRIRVGSAE